MSYRLIDNETNEDIIDKLSRIKDERDKYEKILDKIKEKCKEEKEVHFNNGTIINGLAIYILELLEEIE